MAHVIAMAGKGGVGKTTLTGILIQEMCRAKKGTDSCCGCRCQL